MITKPELPPRDGYIEDEDANGGRYYRKTDEQVAKESQLERVKQDKDTLTQTVSKLNNSIQSNSVLEECLVEMAGIVYA